MSADSKVLEEQFKLVGNTPANNLSEKQTGFSLSAPLPEQQNKAVTEQNETIKILPVESVLAENTEAICLKESPDAIATHKINAEANAERNAKTEHPETIQDEDELELDEAELESETETAQPSPLPDTLKLLQKSLPKPPSASVSFKLSPVQTPAGYLLEVQVSHRTLGEKPLCLSFTLSGKESKEFAENRTLKLSSLPGFEQLHSNVRDSLNRASVQLSSKGEMCVSGLPPDRFSYSFETSGDLMLNNVNSQMAEINIKAARVKVIGSLEAGLGLSVRSAVLDTRRAKVCVPQGKCVFGGLAKNKTIAWFNDQGELQVNESLEVTASKVSNKRGRIQLGAGTHKYEDEAEKIETCLRLQVLKGFDNSEGVLDMACGREASFRAGSVYNNRGQIKLSGVVKQFECTDRWLQRQGASFISEQSVKGAIGKLVVINHSVFHIEGNADLDVSSRVVCRDSSSVTASQTLNIQKATQNNKIFKTKKILSDDTSLIKGGWIPHLVKVKGCWIASGVKYPHPSSKTSLYAKTAVLESPLVSPKVAVETNKICNLSRGTYAFNSLTVTARGRLGYAKVDAGQKIKLVQPNQGCQLQHPLNTKASVTLEGLTSGATKAPLSTKGNVTFKATLQDPAAPYTIHLSQPVKAREVIYQGKGVEQLRERVSSERTYFKVDNLNIHPDGGHSARIIKTAYPLIEFHWHEYAFNATETLTLKMRDGRVFDNPLLNSGGIVYEVAATATTPQSFQASLISGAYLVYLHPYDPTTQPSLKVLFERLNTARQQTPLLIRKENKIWTYGLNAKGKKKLSLLTNDMASHPLFSKIQFPAKRSEGFRGDQKMMAELYRILKEKRAHFAPSMPLTVHAPSIPVRVGDKNKNEPTAMHALHGKFNIASQQLQADHPWIYGRNSVDLNAAQSFVVGHPIARDTNKSYSEIQAEGPINFRAGEGPVTLYSTKMDGVGEQSHLTVESLSGGFHFYGSQARIGGDAYLPKDTRIEIGVASQVTAYNQLNVISRKGAFFQFRHWPSQGKEQWATTEKAHFECEGTAFCDGRANILGSYFHPKKLLSQDRKTACELVANDFEEQRLVSVGYGAQALQTPIPFKAQIASTTLKIGQNFGTGSGWGSVMWIQGPSFHYGPTGNVQVKAVYLHESQWALTKHLRPSCSYTFNSPYSDTIQSSLLPIVYPQYKRAPVIVKLSNGTFVQNTENLPRICDTQTEFNLVNDEIMRQTGKPFLSECQSKQENYEKIVNDTQQYFHRLFGGGANQSGALQVHSSNLSFDDPILVYEEVRLADGKRALTPLILNPYKPEHIALYYASLRADYLIIDVDDKMTLTGNFIADKGMGIKARKMDVHQLQYVTTQQVTVTQTSGKLFHKKTTHQTITQTIITSQIGSGNIVVLDGLLNLNIDDLHLQGAQIFAKKGIRAKIGQLVIVNNMDQYYEYHYSKARNLLRSQSTSEYLARFHVVETTIRSSEGAIDLHCSGDARLVACRVEAEQGIKIRAEGALLLEDVVYRQETGTKATSKKLMLTVTRGAAEAHVPVVFFSGAGEVDLRSGTNLQGIAPQTFAKGSVRYVAPQVRLDVRILNRYLQSKSSGISGFSVVKQKTQATQQTASQTVVISQGDIECQATEENLILVAPFLKAAGDILLRAKKEVLIEDAHTLNTVDTRTYSAGLQFFGSDAIQALMQKDFKAAADRLLKSLPVLGDIKTLMESRDVADGSANALMAVYKTYQFMQSMGQSGDFWKDLGEGLKKSLGDVGVRFSSGSCFESSTLALMPWLMARNVLIASDEASIRMTGPQVQAEESILLKAKQNIDIEASSEEQSQGAQEKGITPTFNPFTLSPGVSVDMQKQRAWAKTFKQCLFEAPEVRLISGDKIDLAGVLVKAQHVFLESQVIRMTSLQDEAGSSQKGASASIGLNSISGSVSWGSSQSKTTSASTEIQASNTLHIRAHQSTHLTGVKIGVGNSGEPIPVELPFGEPQVLYEYPMPEDGDSLFHALGIPRAIAAKQLLDEKGNKDMRELLATEILDVILNSSTVPASLNSLELQALLKTYREVRDKKTALEALEVHVRKTAAFEAYIVGYLAQPTTVIGISPTLNAIAEINGLHIQVLEGDDKGPLKVTREYQPSQVNQTILLRYSATAGSFTLLHNNPGLFVSPVLTYQDLEDIDKSQHTKLGGGLSLAPKSGTAKSGSGDKKVDSDKPEQPAEGSSKDSEQSQSAKPSGGFNPMGTLDVGHKRSETHELHRTTVSSNIDIKTQSEISSLNRDLSRAREITKKSKTHVRVFTPIASLDTLKKMPQQMGQQFARIPAYFKPNTVEHYQAQALSKELAAYQKQGLSDEVIQEKVQDQKVLAEIAQRGNQAFVEQYFTRIGSTVPPKAQKSLDEGLTPHFEQGQEGDKVLVFSEPQHISLEADGGKLNLVVQLGERPQIKPAPARQLSQGATAKPKPDKTKQLKTKPTPKERSGSNQPSRSDNPFRLGADIDEVALYYSGLADESQAFDEGFGLSTVERKYSSETDEMISQGLDDDIPMSFSLGGSRSSKQPSPSISEKTLDFFSPVHAEPSFREEESAKERNRDLLFGYTLQHSRSGPRKGSTFKSAPNYLGEASGSSEPKDPLVRDQRQRLEKLSGFPGRDQGSIYTLNQHNQWWNKYPQIEPGVRDEASSSVLKPKQLSASETDASDSSTPAKSHSVSKQKAVLQPRSHAPKQSISWTKPLPKEQWEKLLGAVVAKMRQEFNRQGYHVSDSTLQEIAAEQLAHCHSMQDLMRLGEKLKERNAQFSDELPHYVQVAYSPGHMQANALIAVQEFVKALLYLLPPFIASNYSKNQSGAKNNSSKRYIEPEQDDLSELEGHKDSSMGNTRYLTVEERQDREDLASRLEVYRKELNKQGHSFERDLGPEQDSFLDGRRGFSEKDNSSRRYLELDAQEDLMRRFGHPVPETAPSKQGNSSGRDIRLENREGLRLGSNSFIHGTDYRENTLIFPGEPHKPTILITPLVQEGFNDNVETFPAEIHLPTTLITPPHERDWRDSVYTGPTEAPKLPLLYMFDKTKEVGDTAVKEKRIYDPTSKHEVRGKYRGHGSENPITTLDEGQKLLDSAYTDPSVKQVYNIHNGEIIKFQPDNMGKWHAYVVKPGGNPSVTDQVPYSVLEDMHKDGLISKPKLDKFRKNK